MPYVDYWNSDMTQAPSDGTLFLAALQVYNSKGEFIHWDINLISNDGGRIPDVLHQGWELSDYTKWFPVPPLPRLAETQ